MPKLPRSLLHSVAIIIFTSLSCNVCLATPLYKSVDANGNPIYTDQKPADPAAETLQVPELQTYQPQPVPAAKSEVVKAPELPVITYKKLAIAAPAKEETFQNQDIISVKLELEPKLAPDHKIQLFLNGADAGEPSTNTTIELKFVDRGEQSLQAKIIAKDNKVLKESESVIFYVHRHSSVVQ